MPLFNFLFGSSDKSKANKTRGGSSTEGNDKAKTSSQKTPSSSGQLTNEPTESRGQLLRSSLTKFASSGVDVPHNARLNPVQEAADLTPELPTHIWQRVVFYLLRQAGSPASIHRQIATLGSVSKYFRGFLYNVPEGMLSPFTQAKPEQSLSFFLHKMPAAPEVLNHYRTKILSEIEELERRRHDSGPSASYLDSTIAAKRDSLTTFDVSRYSKTDVQTIHVQGKPTYVYYEQQKLANQRLHYLHLEREGVKQMLPISGQIESSVMPREGYLTLTVQSGATRSEVHIDLVHLRRERFLRETLHLNNEALGTEQIIDIDGVPITIGYTKLSVSAQEAVYQISVERPGRAPLSFTSNTPVRQHQLSLKGGFLYVMTEGCDVAILDLIDLKQQAVHFDKAHLGQTQVLTFSNRKHEFCYSEIPAKKTGAKSLYQLSMRRQGLPDFNKILLAPIAKFSIDITKPAFYVKTEDAESFTMDLKRKNQILVQPHVYQEAFRELDFDERFYGKPQALIVGDMNEVTTFIHEPVFNPPNTDPAYYTLSIARSGKKIILNLRSWVVDTYRLHQSKLLLLSTKEGQIFFVNLEKLTYDELDLSGNRLSAAQGDVEGDFAFRHCQPIPGTRDVEIMIGLRRQKFRRIRYCSKADALAHLEDPLQDDPASLIDDLEVDDREFSEAVSASSTPAGSPIDNQGFALLARSIAHAASDSTPKPVFAGKSPRGFLDNVVSLDVVVSGKEVCFKRIGHSTQQIKTFEFYTDIRSIYFLSEGEFIVTYADGSASKRQLLYVEQGGIFKGTMFEEYNAHLIMPDDKLLLVSGHVLYAYDLDDTSTCSRYTYLWQQAIAPDHARDIKLIHQARRNTLAIRYFDPHTQRYCLQEFNPSDNADERLLSSQISIGGQQTFIRRDYEKMMDVVQTKSFKAEKAVVSFKHSDGSTVFYNADSDMAFIELDNSKLPNYLTLPFAMIPVNKSEFIVANAFIDKIHFHAVDKTRSMHIAELVFPQERVMAFHLIDNNKRLVALTDKAVYSYDLAVKLPHSARLFQQELRQQPCKISIEENWQPLLYKRDHETAYNQISPLGSHIAIRHYEPSTHTTHLHLVDLTTGSVEQTWKTGGDFLPFRFTDDGMMLISQHVQGAKLITTPVDLKHFHQAYQQSHSSRPKIALSKL